MMLVCDLAESTVVIGPTRDPSCSDPSGSSSFAPLVAGVVVVPNVERSSTHPVIDRVVDGTDLTVRVGFGVDQDVGWRSSVPYTPDVRPDVVLMPVPVTPEGWTVIEYGDVRLSVPNGPCFPGPESDVSVRLECGSTVVGIGPGGLHRSPPPEDGDVLDVAIIIPEPCANTCLVASVRGLGLDVRVESPNADVPGAVIETLGVSTRWRAMNEPLPSVPAGWQEIDAQDGVTPCPRRSEVEFDSPPASAGLTSTVSGPEMVSRGPRNRSR